MSILNYTNTNITNFNNNQNNDSGNPAGDKYQNKSFSTNIYSDNQNSDIKQLLATLNSIFQL